MTANDHLDRFALSRRETAVLLIDYQERLFAAMPEKARERHLKNVCTLLEAAKVLSLPVVATEQYPKGIGPTLEAVRNAYPDLNPIEKTEFSCCRNETARGALEKLGRKKLLIVGMETHVCVYQTVLDLLEWKYAPHVVAEGCLSRSRENWESGLRLASEAGAIVTNLETALFQLLGKAGGDEFKAVSKLIK